VLRVALDMDAKPDEADFRPHQLWLQRFRYESAVGVVAALQAGKRTVAGAFLFDDGLEMDGRRGSEARGANRIEGEQRPRKSGFHIACAATVHPLSVEARLEGRRRPTLPVPCRHNIDMAVEDQRAPLAMRRTIRSDHIVGIFISRVDDRREA